MGPCGARPRIPSCAPYSTTAWISALSWFAFTGKTPWYAPWYSKRSMAARNAACSAVGKARLVALLARASPVCRPATSGRLPHVELVDAVAHDGEEAVEQRGAQPLRLRRLRQLEQVQRRALLCRWGTV